MGTAPRTIVVHRNKEPFDVLIDRTTPWGNPFSHKPSTLAEIQVATRGEAIDCFKTWVVESDDERADWIRRHAHTLRGLRLGCWCHPLNCHGWVLADLADGRPIQIQGTLLG
jgi:hypothetical protein